MLLQDVPAFSRVRVVRVGTLDTTDADAALVGEEVVTWTRLQGSDDPFAAVEIRGVLRPSGELRWLSEDAEVSVLERPRFAGDPSELVKQARPWPKPSGAGGVMETADGWHPLIWQSDLLYSPVANHSDPEIACEVILCALTHAPDDEVYDTLLAALNARYAKLLKSPRVYPPSRFPWANGGTPDEEYLT